MADQQPPEDVQMKQEQASDEDANESNEPAEYNIDDENNENSNFSTAVSTSELGSRPNQPNDIDDESQSSELTAGQDKATKSALDKESKLAFGVALRKSSRSVTKQNKEQRHRHIATKGRSRRAVFKKSVYKSAPSFASPVTSSHIYHNGTYYQIGDIVSLEDIDGGIYYAQLQGFLQDQYCEKSAMINWLIPTTRSPVDGSFDPATFILGPREDAPRKLEYMAFVMHAPSDYYKSTAPFPTVRESTSGFIWTRLGPSLVNKNEIDKN